MLKYVFSLETEKSLTLSVPVADAFAVVLAGSPHIRRVALGNLVAEVERIRRAEGIRVGRVRSRAAVGDRLLGVVGKLKITDCFRNSYRMII